MTPNSSKHLIEPSVMVDIIFSEYDYVVYEIYNTLTRQYNRYISEIIILFISYIYKNRLQHVQHNS